MFAQRCVLHPKAQWYVFWSVTCLKAVVMSFFLASHKALRTKDSCHHLSAPLCEAADLDLSMKWLTPNPSRAVPSVCGRGLFIIVFFDPQELPLNQCNSLPQWQHYFESLGEGNDYGLQTNSAHLSNSQSKDCFIFFYLLENTNICFHKEPEVVEASVNP